VWSTVRSCADEASETRCAWPAFRYVVEVVFFAGVESRVRVVIGGGDDHGRPAERCDGGDFGEGGRRIWVFGVDGRTRLLRAQGLEDVRRVGAIVGHGAEGGVPCRRPGVEREQPANFGRNVEAKVTASGAS
jgi:hypothetical protein